MSLWSLCYTKEPLSPEYKVSHLSPIAPLSLRGFLYERNQLPVLTHHELRGTQPTQSAQSSTALSDVIGSFGFSLCLYLPPISARSIGHCPFSILGAKLIEEQFSALLNNSQWHFSAVLDTVIRQPNSFAWRCKLSMGKKTAPAYHISTPAQQQIPIFLKIFWLNFIYIYVLCFAF